MQGQIGQLITLHKELYACIGQDVVEIGGGGIKFESLPQTINLIQTHNPSCSYHVFMDMNTLLDDLGSSSKDFIGEKYHAQKNRFENEPAARMAASFGREFGKV